MIKDLMDHLKSNGLTVYFTGQHQGEVKSPHVVIRESGSFSSNGPRLNKKLIELILYVPLTSYVAMEKLDDQVRDLMVELKDFKPTGRETPTIPDDPKAGYTKSIEYQILRDYKRRK